MDDIRRWDQKLFIKELLRFRRIFWGGIVGFGLSWLVSGEAQSFLLFVALATGISVLWAVSAFAASVKRRFGHPRFRALWEQVRSRMVRFDEALTQSRKAKVADFEELPKTVRAVAHNLYAALRRADVVFGELVRSEGAYMHMGETPPKATPDAQANELYRVADRNVAEYKQQVRGVLAGVERTEAQVAVFTSTLDTLRVKLLSYRLTGRSPEMQSKEFLESIVEAKMQFDSIDKALEELELTPWPAHIATVPPPLPDDARIHQRLEDPR